MDTVIIGAGAAGLMCACCLNKLGEQVAIIDHNDSVGKKLRIAGGGKVNFTNLDMDYTHYITQNKNFPRSALAGFTPDDMLQFIHGIPYEERSHKQLFLKTSSSDLLDRMLSNIKAKIYLGTTIEDVQHNNYLFEVITNKGTLTCKNLVIATGGISYPQLGATSFGMSIAKQFGHKIIPTRPGLTPLLVHGFHDISGVSLPVQIGIKGKKQLFNCDLLFTHKGISGPAALQISNYWVKDDAITIDFLPDLATKEALNSAINAPQNGKKQVGTIISYYLPLALVKTIVPEQIYTSNCASLPKISRATLYETLFSYTVTPKGYENFDKAEVTIGGVCTKQISSKTMESALQKGLFFIGEVLDVAGELGGYNIHWAFASAKACAKGIG